MQLEEIRAALRNSLTVSVPTFDPDTTARLKFEALGDYMLDTARHRARLEEALDWLIEIEKGLRDEWDRIVGYETALPRGSKHTREHITEAKRQMQPQTYEALREVRSLKERIGRQIRRLEIDKDTVSRNYTLATGG
jgi:hypothetical protein